MGVDLERTASRMLPFAIAFSLCAPPVKAYPGDDVMRAATACDQGNLEGCRVLLSVAIPNCQAGNAQACWIVATLRNRGITQGDPQQSRQQQAPNPTDIIGTWGASSTPIYSSGPSYGLSYTFTPDGTYIFASSFGTQRGKYTVSGSTVILTGTEPPSPPKQWAWGFADNGYGRRLLRLVTEHGPLELYPR